MENNYILKEIKDMKILINLNIINNINEYNEYEPNKYKNKILLIIIKKHDIIILSSKELFNEYYCWVWSINDGEFLIQNKKLLPTKNLKSYEFIYLALNYINKNLIRRSDQYEKN